VNGYASELMTLLDQQRESTALSNQLIRENHYGYAGDPTETLLPPPVKDEVPYLNFSSLQNALGGLEKTTNRLSDSLSKLKLPESRQDAVNQALYKAEQQLLSDNGLPRRSWYRHAIYAPGFYTGYGVKTLPGIREAIEQRNWKEAQEQIEVAAAVLKKFTAYLDSIPL
jgi:N-acetylated-alpha-linked acidic dipeptidase